MPLDPAYIGRSYPPTTTYEVSREKIREFADAIGDDNPFYHDAAAAKSAGYPDVIAPPTFLMLLNLAAMNDIAADPELGLDYSRMVHGDQEFSHQRPVHAGDRLRLTGHIEQIMARAGNDFLTIRTEIHDDHDKIVSIAHSQLVVRGENA